MKLKLELVIGAIVVVVLGYMIYTHFLSRPTMVKIQKDKHKDTDNIDGLSPKCQEIVSECLQDYKEGGYKKGQDPSPCYYFDKICNGL